MTNYKEWTSTIANLKRSYPELHFHYSSKEGWCVVSFKGKSVSVFHWHNKDEIESLLKKLK
ncbi:MAG TPA: hypothetical protein PK431_13960 [Chitinophagales bacterium]|nr:hypothetical protein [Chitinophagales bacterium]